MPGERKLEPKPPLLWVQSPANYESTQKPPVSPTIAGEHTLLPHRFEYHPQQVQQGKRRSSLFRLKLPAFQGIEYTFVEAMRVVKRKQHPLRAGEQVGIVPTFKALDAAREQGLDLVEVSPEAKPPVCKILDFGKFKYEAQKKKNEARKKQKVIEVKEIKLRPSIDDHDYDVKMRSMVKFIDEGDKVKVTMRFRGRELAHQELGMNVLVRVRDDLEEVAKVEQMPRMEGRQMTMVISPK